MRGLTERQKHLVLRGGGVSYINNPYGRLFTVRKKDPHGAQGTKNMEE